MWLAKFRDAFLNTNFRNFLLLFLISCYYFIICEASVPESGIKGLPVFCKNEGEIVKVKDISTDPCITCKCQNHVVSCDRKRCSLSSSCYLATPGRENECCDVCKECEWKGTRRSNNDHWSDQDDPCLVHTCQSGVLTHTRVECHVKCAHPLPPLPGECCPRCPSPTCQGYADTLGVQNTPRTYSLPVTEKETTDPCVQCQCLNGFSTCFKKACPVLACPETKRYHRSGDCCPQCMKGFKRIRERAGFCYIGKQDLRHGQKLPSDDYCTKCECNNTTVTCWRKTCPSLSCPPEHQVKDDGDCCRKCRDPQLQEQVCNVRGKVYDEGETWWAANCTKCTCRNLKVRCEAVDCSRLNPCPPGFQERLLPGECCRTCVEADGVCSAFGDSGYKTFDGDVYGFKSLPCRYLLSKDCAGNNFSISVVNDLKHGVTKIRSVVLKVDNTKVQLGQNIKVKIGRKRVRLPHVILSVLSIRLENKSVVVRTNMGVKLLWDDENYLEVHTPTVFKNKLCGLCGNYDNDPKNDRRTKKGQAATNTGTFSHSWMSGKKPECKAKTEVLTKELNDCDRQWEFKWDSRRRARMDCNRLSDLPLATCHSNIDSNPYMNTCIQEHCACKTPKKCHCQVFKAYVRECERMGVVLNDWRNSTNCQGSHCPPGSVYTQCGSSCRMTCKNYHQSRIANCHKKCQPGCECGKGMVWHRHRCISPQYCPRT